MKNILHKIKFLALIFLVPAIGLAFSTNASAEETAKYWLAITPTQSNLATIEPGETYTGTFNVINKGTERATFEVDFKPYTVTDENYTPAFGNYTQYTEISEWITTSPKTSTVEPGERAEVRFTINVPKDAHGGSQMAAIIVRLVKGNDGNSSTAVEMVQELAYLVYGNVDGDVTEKGSVVSNKVPGFVFDAPLKVTAIMRNDGNIYTRATHLLEVRNFFNNSLEYSNSYYQDGEEIIPGSIVFPETNRYNEVTWDNIPTIGIFKVKSVVKIFNDESIVEKTVIVCPLWLIVVIVLFIGLAIFWIISRIMKRRD